MKRKTHVPPGLWSLAREQEGMLTHAQVTGAGFTRTSIQRLFDDKAVWRIARGLYSLTPDPNQAELQATLFGLSRRLEMDSTGRVRLPDEQLSLTGLPREVALVGAGEWLEIRDRAAWRATMKERLEQLPKLLAGIQPQRNGL